MVALDIKAIDANIRIYRNGLKVSTTGNVGGNETEITAEIPKNESKDIKAKIRKDLFNIYPKKLWELIYENESKLVLRKRQPPSPSNDSVRLSEEYNKSNNNLKYVFGKTEVFDVFSHHNQMLDLTKKALDNNKIAKGFTLLHFDAHSDIYLNVSRRRTESIADYINTMVQDESISEMYWVLPDWTKKNPENRKLFWPTEEEYKMNAAQWKERSMLDYKTDCKLYVQDNKVFNDAPKTGNYRTVNIHKVTMDELPDFKNKCNICADIDMDYFSNSGFDTAGGDPASIHNASATELDYELPHFIDALSFKNIQPEMVNLSRSPKYTPDEDVVFIESYFRNIFTNILGKNEYIVDTADSYKHGREKDEDMNLLIEIKNALEQNPTSEENGGGEKIAEKLRLRGFNEVLDDYETLKHENTEINRGKLLDTITQTINKLGSRKYSFNLRDPNIQYFA